MKYVTLIVLILTSPALMAEQAYRYVYYSPDQQVEVAPFSVPDDSAVVVDQQSGLGLRVVPKVLPKGNDLSGIHEIDANTHVFSVANTMILDGVAVRPNQVVRYEQADGPKIVFDGAAWGVPSGVKIDAVSMYGTAILFSLDQTTDLNGETVGDEDILLYEKNGNTAPYILLDGSAAGLSADMDIDAVHLSLEFLEFFLSLDQPGSVSGLSFDDDDVLAYNPETGAWRMASLNPSRADWYRVDLDAFYAVGLYDNNLIFLNGFE